MKENFSDECIIEEIVEERFNNVGYDSRTSYRDSEFNDVQESDGVVTHGLP